MNFQYLWLNRWIVFGVPLAQCTSSQNICGRYWIIIISGSIVAVAIIVKHEIVLAIIGGLFVLETVSVIIQVISLN